MEVTERFLRQGDLLYYNFTVNDPEVLMEPWTSYTYVRRVNHNPNRQDEATPNATSGISSCSTIRSSADKRRDFRPADAKNLIKDVPFSGYLGSTRTEHRCRTSRETACARQGT